MSMPTPRQETMMSMVGCARVQATLLESMIFSSCLNKLLLSVDVDDINVSMLDMIPNEMMTNLNMLRLEVLHRVERNLDGTFIVTPKRHFFTNDTLIL